MRLCPVDEFTANLLEGDFQSGKTSVSKRIRLIYPTNTFNEGIDPLRSLEGDLILVIWFRDLEVAGRLLGVTNKEADYVSLMSLGR